MTLWNQVLTQVLTVQAITFGQALGIFLLCKILFGGFKGRNDWRKRGPWNQQMREKWQHMTPEDQHKFKQDWRNRCNRWGEPFGERGERNTEQAPKDAPL